MRSLARRGLFLSLVLAAAASASPSAGTLGLSAAAYTVSESGGSVLITVDRTGGSTGAVSVYYATVTGTATSSDYAPKAGRLYWNDGDSSPKTFSVPILDTDDFSGSKQFSVDIKDVYGGAALATQAATVTIIGNGGAGALHLSSSSFSVSQSLGSLSVAIDRTGGSAGAVSVFYATAPGSATTSNFSMKNGRLSWANGDMSPKTFVVPISDAVPFTGTKQFTITIKDVYGAATLGTPTTATVTILGSATTSVPAAPAGLSAAPGNGQVSLTWSASSGATSYHVMRSTTSGGPYTQVGAPTSTSYTDTALTNGTTYYYVVSALDSAGASANSAQVTATPTAAVSVAGLHVSGNQILNGRNQAVPLRGVDKSGTEYMCLGGPLVFDGPSDAASVTTLQSWAINIVRLPLNEDCWLGINGAAVGGTAYQTAIVDYVNLLTAGNIATIIDLQWAAPGTTLANQQTPMPDSDHAPAFWTSVANTFKSNSSVLFDLFNEPYPDSNQDSTAAWACLKNGGTCPGVSYPAASMQSLVNAIRATDSTNVIMVPGVQYTNTLTQWLANKPTDASKNLAASWHSYADEICNSQACWDSEIKPVLQSVPLITGEIGENDCQDIYVNPLMAYLDANGGNYLAWGWDTYNCSSFPALISDYDGTPTAFGAGIRNHFLELSGQAQAALAPRDP